MLCVWVNDNTTAKVYAVCEGVYAGCMVCCFNPDGLRLPGIQFCQDMMSNDKHTSTFTSVFVHLQISHNVPESLQLSVAPT